MNVLCIAEGLRGLKEVFLLYLALDVTPNCICEIHFLALDGFDLNTVHKLRSKGKNQWPNELEQKLGLCSTSI